MKLVTALCSLSLISLAFACSTTKVTKLPGGGFRISCEGGLNECATRAEKICGAKGFTVTYGKSKTEVLGGPSSNYQKAATSGFLEGVCGEPKRELDESGREKVVFQLGGSEAPAPEASATPAPELATPPAPARACVPGASQKCFGAGACEGGQACLADGSGFGPCQCAAAAPSVPNASVAPSPAPTK